MIQPYLSKPFVEIYQLNEDLWEIARNLSNRFDYFYKNGNSEILCPRSFAFLKNVFDSILTTDVEVCSVKFIEGTPDDGAALLHSDSENEEDLSSEFTILFYFDSVPCELGGSLVFEDQSQILPREGMIVKIYNLVNGNRHAVIPLVRKDIKRRVLKVTYKKSVDATIQHQM